LGLSPAGRQPPGRPAPPRHLPLGLVGGNDGDEHDQPGIQEQRRDFGNPADILQREAQIPVPLPSVSVLGKSEKILL
jgi:hypothetical protein